MALDVSDFLASPAHFEIFVDAARQFNCHILVRETGRASLKWVGLTGYTGKRADMKAKTSNRNAGQYLTAGLVCSPFLQPGAFEGDRIRDAHKEWSKSEHLITVPDNEAGFGDNDRLVHCRTPYIVQTNRRHRHYGCVALVEKGLLAPRYVHGDYDLYAIIPAGRPYQLGATPVRNNALVSTMSASSLQEAVAAHAIKNMETSLSFKVANFINTRIAAISHDVMGALMVNHGEQVNLGKVGWTHKRVLAIMPRMTNGEWGIILDGVAAHTRFFENV